LDHASANDYNLGVKLVRGAYHEHEMAAYNKEEISAHKAPVPPVWTIKSETDINYNRCAKMLVDRISDQEGIPLLGVMFATHNRRSCELVLETLVEKGLAKSNGDQLDVSPYVGNQIQFAQLYGGYLSRITLEKDPNPPQPWRTN
jgi:proline dehydrogenase